MAISIRESWEAVLVVRRRLIRAFILLWSFFPRVSVAGQHEVAALEVMTQLRASEAANATKRDEELGDLYLKNTGYNRSLVLLALGESNVDANPRVALQFLSAAEGSLPKETPLQKVIRYYLAKASLISGAKAHAAELTKLLLMEDSGDAWGRMVQGLRIEALFALNDFAGLEREFAAYGKKFSFSRRQESLAKIAALALEARGEKERAWTLLEELARGYPTTDESRWAFRRLAEYACEQKSHKRYRYSERLLLHLARNIVLDTGLEPFILAQIEQPLVGDDDRVKRFGPAEKADFLYRARLYKSALASVKKIYEDEKSKPRSNILANLQFELGRIHLRLHDPLIATRYFSDFLFDYPAHPLSTQALEYLGDALRYMGEPLAAAQSYSDVLQRRDSALLRWMRFWCYLRGKDYVQALALLETPGYLSPREGDDPVTLTYWHARLLEKLGRSDEAATKFREVLAQGADSFYGVATATLHPDMVSGGSSDGIAEEPSDERGEGLAARLLASPVTLAEINPTKPDLQLIADLSKVGMREAATALLSGIKWNGYDEEDSFRQIARVSSSLDDYRPARNVRYAAFTALKSLPRDLGDLVMHQKEHAEDWKLFYPIAFPNITLPVASRLGMNPFLVLSIMRAESYYNKDARSPVGAQGLMQLMPYTAVKIATQLHDEAFTVSDLASPETNIVYGSYYLGKLLRFYDQNPILAAAAYNGGPMVVNHWLESCKDCTADEFVDSIPYRETRRYVREVMRNLAQYSRIYLRRQPFSALPKMPSELPEGEELF